MTADADAEMREAPLQLCIAEQVVRAMVAPGSVRPMEVAIAILAELRRRGAWLPGDPITDALVEVAWCNDRDGKNPPFIIFQCKNELRAAITAAMAARKP